MLMLLRLRPALALFLFLFAGIGIFIQWLRTRGDGVHDSKASLLTISESTSSQLQRDLEVGVRVTTQISNRQTEAHDPDINHNNPSIGDPQSTSLEQRVPDTGVKEAKLTNSLKAQTQANAEETKSDNAVHQLLSPNAVAPVPAEGILHDKLTVLPGYISVLDDQPLKLNCKTCALVSSSGRILGKKKGSEIDQADCVFRMNSAPVEGFETDVGHKTTVRLLSQFSVPHGLRLVSHHTDQPLNFFIAWGAEGHLGKKTQKYGMMLETAKKYPAMGIYRSSDKHYWYQDEVFQAETGQERMKSGTWLSTGWFTFDVIKQACPRTKIYGMIPETFCRNGSAPPALYHYWERNAGDECSYYRQMENRVRAAHRFMSEKTVFARWAIKYNMTFHVPDWDPKDYSHSEIKFPTFLS